MRRCGTAGAELEDAAKELRQRIGIQLQETQFPDKLTVEETLRLFRSFYRRGISVEESIKTAQLEEKRKCARGRADRRAEAAAGDGVRAGGRSRSCCFWMSRRRGSIRRRGGTCGIWWMS